MLRPGGDGTSELWALLPDEGAAAVMAAITALAERHDRAMMSGGRISAAPTP